MEEALRDAKAECSHIQEQLEKKTVLLTDLRGKLDQQERMRRQLARAIAVDERDFAQTDPDSYWATPPAIWPQWDARCPYIWIRKEVLPRLPVQPFTEQGILIPEVAAVLVISEQQKAKLDALLSKLTGEYHKLENEAVELSDDHLPGVGDGQGEKITIKIKSTADDAARFRKEFETDLKDTLGSQRGELLADQANSWLNRQFDQSSKIPKTITMVRQENGFYGIAIRGDNSWFSTAVPRMAVANEIPEHFLHFFDPILGASDIETASP